MGPAVMGSIRSAVPLGAAISDTSRAFPISLSPRAPMAPSFISVIAIVIPVPVSGIDRREQDGLVNCHGEPTD